MPPKKKPGPMSSKSRNESASRIDYRNAGLGDDTCSDHSDVENTDYGFQYTSHSIQVSENSVRRRSVLSQMDANRDTEGASTSATARKRSARAPARKPAAGAALSPRQESSSASSPRRQPPSASPSGRQPPSASPSVRQSAAVASPRRQRTSAAAATPPATPTRRPAERSQNQSSPHHRLPNAAPSAAAPPAAAPPAARRKQLNPVRKEKRFLKEVRKLQEQITPLIPKLCFGRVVREFLYDFGVDGPFRITRGALETLQEATEIYLTQRLEDAYLLTLHRGRVTLSLKDLRLVSYLKSGVRN